MRDERVNEQVSLLYLPSASGGEEPHPEEDWDYATADTKTHPHGFHTYPAMMIPQVARRLVRMYGRAGDTLLDPFCGSGTSPVEARLARLTAYGVLGFTQSLTQELPLRRQLWRTLTGKENNLEKPPDTGFPRYYRPLQNRSSPI